MTSDVRDLLREATPEPRRALDIGAVVESAHRRRRRRRVLAVASAVCVVAVTGGVAALTTGGTTSEIRTSGVVAGTNAAAGVSVTMPSGWMDLARVTRGYPPEILVVGNAARPTDDPIRACPSGDPLPSSVPLRSGSVYVSLYEYDAGNSSLVLPGNDGTISPGSFSPRGPDGSVSRLFGASTCGTPVPASPPGSAAVTTTVPAAAANRFDEAAFRDAGRIFVARIVSIDDPSGQLLQSGYDVLKTLRVDPRTPTSSGPVITLPTVSTLPKPTGPPRADQAAARQAILDAFRSAFGGGGPVAHTDAIEGGEPNNAATQQSAAAANPSLIGSITPRINLLVFLDRTRAVLNFDLLVNGQPVTANTTGQAIVENGHWKVTRATYCEILHRGGTPCAA